MNAHIRFPEGTPQLQAPLPGVQNVWRELRLRKLPEVFCSNARCRHKLGTTDVESDSETWLCSICCTVTHVVHLRAH